jgi:hypothetical protein
MDMSAAASSAPVRARSADRTWQRLLGAALLTFVVWRGSLFLFDLVGLSLVPNMGACRRQWQLFGKGHELLDGFFRWDAAWYLNIAEGGYSFYDYKSSSVAFYPLLPYLARYLGKLVGSVPIAGLIIVNAATVGALYYLRRLGGLLHDDAVGKLAGILLLVFPTSFFLSAFYTEALFVCLAAGSMFHYLRGSYLWCGALGFLASLTRSTGLVLFVAVAADLGVSLYRRESRLAPRMAALLLIPAGLGVFMFMQYVQVGDPLAFTKTMTQWGRHAVWPWEGIAQALAKTSYTFPINFGKTQRFLDAAFALAFLGLGVVMAIQKQRVVLWVFVILGMLLPLSTFVLASTNRYCLALFPAFIYLASLCRERPELERWLIFVSSLLLAVYSLRFMQCGWAG